MASYTTMTPERIRRHNDERTYQPKIHSRRIRELYTISQETGEPMTVLVDEALREFIERERLDESDKHDRYGGEERNDSSDRPRDRSKL